MCIGDLSWGPRKRHLVLTHPAVPLGRNHAASRRTIGVCTHDRVRIGARAGYINSTANYKFNRKHGTERQTGQDRQSGHSHTGVSEQRPKGIFPPVDVVRMLSEVLPLTSPLEVFCIYIMAVVCMDSQEDRIRRKTRINNK
jgi:hypothetical protein